MFSHFVPEKSRMSMPMPSGAAPSSSMIFSISSAILLIPLACLGFSSPAYFARAFHKSTGKSPSAFRKSKAA